ncbi:FIST signal transduction protein [Piscinibacter sp.]|uniref:FIST signal transduction protein n=1 Tax=Piscinibacter sp. TaxID=1903157 RepID=UPI002B961D74|nr:FIST N-terminal domain-containing protein [Albitalea sp.]HUG24456.1 FIST N-terminal domain-containing protein [Albitalea sp.]
MLHRTVTFRTGTAWDSPLPAEMDGPQTLVLAFAASEFSANPAPFSQLAAAFPKSVLVGCSTSGEIAGTQVHDASVSVAVVRFDHTRLRRAFTRVDGAADSFDAGVRLAAQLGGEDLRAVFVLSDGLCVNGTPLVDGLTRHLPAAVSITGGLAGDGSRFAHTWVLDRDQPEANCICAVGFYGERLRVGHGCDGGWSDFGPERRITRSEGNVLYELDGEPALDLYKTYLGERAEGLPGTALLFPLSVRRDAASQRVVRTILGIDEARQALTFAGDVPQGSIARLMRANTDKLICSAALAARQAVQSLPETDDALIISVSCIGRRLILGERTEEEIETVLEGAPLRAAHVGFYSYGEISPSVPGGASELHNQTMTVTVFSEA